MMEGEKNPNLKEESKEINVPPEYHDDKYWADLEYSLKTISPITKEGKIMDIQSYKALLYCRGKAKNRKETEEKRKYYDRLGDEIAATGTSSDPEEPVEALALALEDDLDRLAEELQDNKVEDVANWYPVDSKTKKPL